MTNKVIECIFVRSGDNPALEKLIAAATDCPYTHAAMRVTIHGKKRIVESKLPAFRITEGDIYDECQMIDIIEVPVSEEQHEAAVEMALGLTGAIYGVDDCVSGGVNDIFGAKVAKFLDCVNSAATLNCSAAMVTILRAVWPKFMLGVKSETVTPAIARIAVMELIAGMKEGRG